MRENEAKKFKKFKKKPLALAVAFLLFSALAFYFLHSGINKNLELAETAYQEWQKETVRREEIRSLERSVSDIQNEMMLLQEHFVSSSNVVPLLDTLERLARDAGASSEVRSVDVSEDVPGLKVSLESQGSFEATYKFTKLLENSPYELEITALDIERLSSQEAGGSTWRGSFTIQLLSFTE